MRMTTTLTHIVNCDCIDFNKDGNGEDAVQIIDNITQLFGSLIISLRSLIMELLPLIFESNCAVFIKFFLCTLS